MFNESNLFEIAQELRAAHCDRKDDAGHQCVGEVTIKRGMVCLDCKLCGKGEDMPGWDTFAARKLASILSVLGIDWGSLDIEAQIRAIRQFKKETSH